MKEPNREGGEPTSRNPPWIKCCLMSYYLDENDPWGSRRYKIYGTRLLDWESVARIISEISVPFMYKLGGVNVVFLYGDVDWEELFLWNNKSSFPHSAAFHVVFFGLAAVNLFELLKKVIAAFPASSKKSVVWFLIKEWPWKGSWLAWMSSHNNFPCYLSTSVFLFPLAGHASSSVYWSVGNNQDLMTLSYETVYVVIIN